MSTESIPGALVDGLTYIIYVNNEAILVLISQVKKWRHSEIIPLKTNHLVKW